MLVICKIKGYIVSRNYWNWNTVYEHEFEMDINFNPEQDIQNIKDIKTALALGWIEAFNKEPKKRKCNVSIHIMQKGKNYWFWSNIWSFDKTSHVARFNIDWAYEGIVGEVKRLDKDIKIIDYVYNPKLLGK